MAAQHFTPLWREQILKSVIDRPRTLIHLPTPDDEFHCIGYHFDAERLLQISHRTTGTDPHKHTVYRFSRYGGLRMIFEEYADGDCVVIYDPQDGIGQTEHAETMASQMLVRLAQVAAQQILPAPHIPHVTPD